MNTISLIEFRKSFVSNYFSQTSIEDGWQIFKLFHRINTSCILCRILNLHMIYVLIINFGKMNKKKRQILNKINSTSTSYSLADCQLHFNGNINEFSEKLGTWALSNNKTDKDEDEEDVWQIQSN